MHLLLLLAACSSMRGADIDPPPPTGDGSYRPSWDPPSIHAEVDFAADDASGAFYLTPHMEDGRLTGSIRRIWPGPVNESVRIDHLFHAECGDGLVGNLIFSDGSVTEGGVTLTPNVGPELQLVATEPGTWALILPVRFEVEDVSDMGCGDRYEGEVLETTFNGQVDLPVPKPAVDLGAACELLVDGSTVPVGLADPAHPSLRVDGAVTLEARGGTTLRVERGTRHVQVVGMGHVDVLLDDALQVSLPVVPPQDISSMDLEIRMADGSFITDAAPSNLARRAAADRRTLRLRRATRGVDRVQCHWRLHPRARHLPRRSPTSVRAESRNL